MGNVGEAAQGAVSTGTMLLKYSGCRGLKSGKDHEELRSATIKGISGTATLNKPAHGLGVEFLVMVGGGELVVGNRIELNDIAHCHFSILGVPSMAIHLPTMHQT